MDPEDVLVKHDTGLKAKIDGYMRIFAAEDMEGGLELKDPLWLKKRIKDLSEVTKLICQLILVSK